MTSFLDRISAGQPAEVRGVLAFAYARAEFDFDAVVAVFAPGHADVLAGIAEDLSWAERFRSERPCAVLSDYYGTPTHGIYLDRACDEHADRHEADAVHAAQMVATLMQTRSAA